MNGAGGFRGWHGHLTCVKYLKKSCLEEPACSNETAKETEVDERSVTSSIMNSNDVSKGNIRFKVTFDNSKIGWGGKDCFSMVERGRVGRGMVMNGSLRSGFLLF